MGGGAKNNSINKWEINYTSKLKSSRLSYVLDCTAHQLSALWGKINHNSYMTSSATSFLYLSEMSARLEMTQSTA